MNEQKMAIDNAIFEARTGSFLYGTNTPESDNDYCGVFVPNTEYILGFHRCDEVSCGKNSKLENGRNGKDAVDRKFYELRKFITLATEGNPNIMELLFVDDKNIVLCTPTWKRIQANVNLFVGKNLKAKYLGYSYSQKHKMVIKKDNYFDLLQGFDFLKKFDDSKLVAEIVSDNNFCFRREYDEKHNCVFVKIGDLNLQPSYTAKKAKSILEQRLNAVGNREELILKYGFDRKFGMHMIRLLLEAKELLHTGAIKFPLENAEQLLDIRLARDSRWSLSGIIEYAEQLEQEVEDAYATSKLPEISNKDAIEKILIDILHDKIQSEYS